MLANITFKAYDSSKKTKDSLLTEFILPLSDTEDIDKICNAIQETYNPNILLSWSISIDHEYI